MRRWKERKASKKQVTGNEVKRDGVERKETMANKREILIVEDSKLQAETLAQILVQEGYAVRSAPDGLEGLSMLAESRPNLVISDVWMPRMNGYELCRALKDDNTARQHSHNIAHVGLQV